MRIASLGLVLALCASTSAIGQPAPGMVMYDSLHYAASTTALNKGRSAIEQGRYGEAKPILDRLVGDGSMNPDVYYLAGLANLGTGSPRRAKELFQVALTGRFVNRRELPSDFRTRAEHGLAMSHILLGERKRAQMLLRTLEARKAKCGTDCESTAALDNAVASLNRLLS
jgi:hypothetical protein